MSLVFSIIFCLNFGRVCGVADVLADSAAIICTSPSPEAMLNDSQRLFIAIIHVQLVDGDLM